MPQITHHTQQLFLIVQLRIVCYCETQYHSSAISINVENKQPVTLPNLMQQTPKAVGWLHYQHSDQTIVLLMIPCYNRQTNIAVTSNNRINHCFCRHLLITQLLLPCQADNISAVVNVQQTGYSVLTVAENIYSHGSNNKKNKI